MLNRFRMDKNGRTAYELIRRKRCKVEIAEFGERVIYKERTGEGGLRNKGESDWKDGIWLGLADRTNETLISTEAGIVKTYAVRRVPVDERWDRDMVLGVRGTLAKPNQQGRGNSNQD